MMTKHCNLLISWQATLLGIVAVFQQCTFEAGLTKVSHFTWTEENEERTMIDPNSKEDPKFKELIKVRNHCFILLQN